MGFFDPAKLIWALSLAALVAIYLRARSRPTIEVSSLMLFEEVPAPVAKSRILRVDALFWLEAAALAALSLALSGLFLRLRQPAGARLTHALVFDLGAGMGAAGKGGGTRMDEAREQAREIVAGASAGDQFTVIGYALEADTIRAASGHRDEIESALKTLHAAAVAARPAALRAALLRASASQKIDLFADRPPPPGVIDDARLTGRIDFHQVGEPTANLALVAIDPGVPRATVGRAVVRNFSDRPRTCELAIDAGGREVFHSPLIIEPRAEVVVPFGPLQAGGVVHARIVTPDALEADNQRWAYAPSIAPAHALVLSPDAAARDDLARIVLAVNPNFQVAAGDPARPGSYNLARKYDLAVLHDCSAGVSAAALMIVFPEPWLSNSKLPPLVPVMASVAVVEMEEREGAGSLGAPVLLGPSRVLELPGWMDATARGSSVGQHDSMPLAAAGRNANGEIGAIAFDVRNHLLLDPDRMDALVAVVDTLKRLIAPQDLAVVSTGAMVSVPAFARATIKAPDGSTLTALPDQWGRARFVPLQAGRYSVTAGGRSMTVLANYFDAGESDLSAPRYETAPSAPAPAAALPSGLEVRPIAPALIVLALAALVMQSLLLLRRAARWGARHV